ncbi:hypothetical protein [Hazenella coriacea]|uniref:hypothetical protein n=1 Tax=Hazenella coriacea TaxID=1179467 RepID=UPI00140470A0|nr:hypothetical protein [Hazenella coriacea]
MLQENELIEWARSMRYMDLIEAWEVVTERIQSASNEYERNEQISELESVMNTIQSVYNNIYGISNVE